MSDAPEHESDDLMVLPIEAEFDLHPFLPAERLEMLDAYLEAALAHGFDEVRVVHGRGRGVARAEVRAFLAADPRVASASEATPDRGGWGATVVRLAPRPSLDASVGQAVFVGDVQGCALEFEELTARIERAHGHEWRLYVAGDAVNRGAHNLRVLERIRTRVDAGLGEMVLGNHEIHLLRVALGMRETGDLDTFHDVLSSSERDDWIAWLRARPLAATGHLGRERWVMVHASVHPDWGWAQVVRESRRVERHLASKDEQDVLDLLDAPPGHTPRQGSPRDVLGRITSARSVKGPRAQWSPRPPAQKGEVAWHVAWSERKHDYGIVFGHWAMQGLYLAPGLRGLDSGCIHHGRRGVGYLSAWVPRARSEPSASAFDTPDDDVWQVRARARGPRSS